MGRGGGKGLCEGFGGGEGEESAKEASSGLDIGGCEGKVRRGLEDGVEVKAGLVWRGELGEHPASEAGVLGEAEGLVEGLSGGVVVLEGELGDGEPEQAMIPKRRSFGLFVGVVPMEEILLKERECVVGLVGEIEQGEVVASDEDFARDAPIVAGLRGPSGVILCGAEGFLVGGVCGGGVACEKGGVSDPEPIERITRVVGDLFEVAGGFAGQAFPSACLEVKKGVEIAQALVGKELLNIINEVAPRRFVGMPCGEGAFLEEGAVCAVEFGGTEPESQESLLALCGAVGEEWRAFGVLE